VLEQFARGEHGLDPFLDPLGEDELGQRFRRRWIAAWADVERRVGNSTAPGERQDTGLKVIAVADREKAMEPARRLGLKLAQMGSLALLFFLLVSGGLLVLVFRSLRRSRERGDRLAVPSTETGGTRLADAATVPGHAAEKNPETPQ
jgi:hypothetical protein